MGPRASLAGDAAASAGGSVGEGLHEGCSQGDKGAAAVALSPAKGPAGRAWGLDRRGWPLDERGVRRPLGTMLRRQDHRAFKFQRLYDRLVKAARSPRHSTANEATTRMSRLRSSPCMAMPNASSGALTGACVECSLKVEQALRGGSDLVELGRVLDVEHHG